ncbi:hypothetical protein [Serratia fonticola]|uniref:hypothetical protein n=1 Tax=Serratia fonticola TaxID=47917 RepID=UPI003AAE99F8
MKKSYWYTAMAIILVLLVLINSYVYQQHYQKTHFYCHGNVTVSNSNYRLNARLVLNFYDKVGQGLIEGKLINRAGSSYSVHRTSSFDVKQEHDNLYLTTSSVTELPGNTADASMLKGLILPNLLTNNNSIHLNLYRITSNNYLFTNDKYMLLYCEK